MNARAGAPKRDPKHANPPRTPFVLLILGMLGGGMCLLLALNTASAANEVRRHDLVDRDQGAAASLVELRNAVAASSAPANLAAAANALGMVPAGNPGFLEIGPDGTVKVLGSAAAASAQPVYIPPRTQPSRVRTSASASARPTSSRSASAHAKSAHPSGSASTSASKSESTSATPSSKRSSTRSSTAAPSHQPSRTPSHTPSHTPTHTPSHKPTPRPTPTPTPTITLPGGDR